MDFHILEGLHAEVDRERVLQSMDCFEDSPVYEDVVEEYEEIIDEMKALVEPIGILGLGKITSELVTERYTEGTPVIFAVLSIGNEIKARSTKAFREGDYVKGMLMDAIADVALFSLEDAMQEQLRTFCAEHKVGISKRLEAPHDIPMAAQKEAWDILKLRERFGIEISEGFMYDPVKTSCQVFILSKDAKQFKAQHDCRNCNNLACKLRNIPPLMVTVHKGTEVKTFELKTRESLMDGLIREGYQFSAACGGRGRCGKCRVRILKGEVCISKEDEAVFSKEELAQGWRLSCKVYPSDEIEVDFALNDESRFEVLTNGELEAVSTDSGSKESAYEVAIDIGTTTIAMELLGKDSHKVLAKAASINSQRVYGADVISRIQASVDGKKVELQEYIRSDLKKGLEQLAEEARIQMADIRRIIISGNTTMGHLLMGYDCDGLGVFPFTPVNIGLISGSSQEILEMDGMEAQVELLPGISTYVGGDIVSGLYACGFDETEEVCMLIDLGTNGEMAIGNRDRILVTSTAAGPAFEGGNITWGTGSVPGAICAVTIENEILQIRTIMDEAPVGICGTGVVETAAELVRAELVDETGLLDEEYFEEGYPLAETSEGKKILFTQKDMREIQLAKAAVRAGAETLALRYGIKKEEITRIYVAGGFGYKLDTDKAIAIGMLPEEFEGRIKAVGNSSLAGAQKYLADCEAKNRMQRLAECAEEIALSTDKAFNEFYMDAMFFE